MRTLFADALYWVALLNPRDQWHRTAREAATEYASARLVTTEAVLIEVLNFYAAFRTEMRQAAAGTVQDVLDDDRTDVVPSSHSAFMDGLELYVARSDKDYSMVDCMSMQVMRNRDLNDVLTHDQHFAQEGFTVLL
jgi:predicted nucleic acid-binding protein